MKTGLMILLLIHMVASSLAAVVPAAVDARQVTADVADKKGNVIITSTESVESAESIESLGSNDPKLTSGTPAIEGNQENQSAESTESIVSAESTESIVSAESTESPLLDNDVLKTSSTFHRRYHYPARYPQYYYRRPVTFGGYYNRYPQRQNVNRYSYYNRQPVYYTRPTYSSPSHSYYNSVSSSSGYSTSDGGHSGDDSHLHQHYLHSDPPHHNHADHHHQNHDHVNHNPADHIQHHHNHADHHHDR